MDEIRARGVGRHICRVDEISCKNGDTGSQCSGSERCAEFHAAEGMILLSVGYSSPVAPIPNVDRGIDDEAGQMRVW